MKTKKGFLKRDLIPVKHRCYTPMNTYAIIGSDKHSLICAKKNKKNTCLGFRCIKSFTFFSRAGVVTMETQMAVFSETKFTPGKRIWNIKKKKANKRQNKCENHLLRLSTEDFRHEIKSPKQRRRYLATRWTIISS